MAGIAARVNVVSVDVEDYFQVEAFADRIERTAWESYNSRVERNTLRMLDLLDECETKATFFILGWVAERFPELVRQIGNRGHEIACHSYWHRPVYSLTPEEFRQDTRRAKMVLEQTCGCPINGYRAPSFSIVKRSWWAFEVLVEEGFRYDSSIFPVRHGTYGIPDAGRIPHVVQTAAGPIVEYPLTTFRIGNGTPNLPVAGGGYLRIFPFWYTRAGVQRVWREGLPVIVYLHPWELDPAQPRLSGRLTSRLRHYTNLNAMEEKVRRLLRLGRFSPFRDSGLIDLVAASSTSQQGC